MHSTFWKRVKWLSLGNSSLLMGVSFMALSAMVVVQHAYETPKPPEGRGTLDSVAIWVAHDPAQSLLMITDKTRNVVHLFDPIRNQFLGRLGEPGASSGQLKRPNGIAVAYNVNTVSGLTDVVFVVERDNNRVSAFSLPERQFLGAFGNKHLDKPYGIALARVNGHLQAWITSTGSSPDRVKVFEVRPGGSGIEGRLLFDFPVDATLESLVIDPEHDRALICAESAPYDIRVYNLKGEYQSRFGAGIFTNDPEGIVLYDLGNGEGYYIVADQEASPTEYEVFDRKTMDYMGNFSGKTSGTDGIALTQMALPNFPEGSFYALHSDRAVHAYDWREIARAMNLKTRVTPIPTSVGMEPGRPPVEFAMVSNYPNPFHPETRIRFWVEKAGRVTLDIVNMRGQVVQRLVDEAKTPGEYQTTWRADGSPLPSQLYFLRLQVGRSTYTRKIILLH
ncbi:MAG: phytase [candidate division KSB1 bacterium]|nr:phytase [candidate division KSB1 bacterium]